MSTNIIRKTEGTIEKLALNWNPQMWKRAVREEALEVGNVWHKM